MNDIETMSAATSVTVMTTGSVCRKRPVSPDSTRNGRYATTFVSVAKKIARASRVGPIHAAISRGIPPASSRSIASPATTGMSTRSPSAMISVAIDTCWMSTPSISIAPNVIASVTGMDVAISSAERQFQNPISDTTTTRKIAS